MSRSSNTDLDISSLVGSSISSKSTSEPIKASNEKKKLEQQHKESMARIQVLETMILKYIVDK